jgi:hypothetical protein
VSTHCQGLVRSVPHCQGWSGGAADDQFAGQQDVDGLADGVEAVRRGGYLFLISHLDAPAEVDLGSPRLDLLTGTTVGPRAALAPRGALVLACDAPCAG